MKKWMFFVLMNSTQAYALPQIQSDFPSLSVTDAWDRSFALQRFKGAPLLLVYEDKDSASMNQLFKDELSKLAQGDRYKNKVALVAVADVQKYNYWPIRGFVKDAIQKESNKQNILIYCDWDGSIKRSFSLVHQMSNIVLYSKEGKALFAHAGPLTSAQRATLFAHLRRELGE